VSTRSRRLEDRIRELCARAVSSEDSEELLEILPELQAALHQAVERVRTKAFAVLRGHRDIPLDRRAPPR
jgi:hypothetical protein